MARAGPDGLVRTHILEDTRIEVAAGLSEGALAGELDAPVEPQGRASQGVVTEQCRSLEQHLQAEQSTV